MNLRQGLRSLFNEAEPETLVERPAASTGTSLVYAIGDVHGRYDLLTLLLERIAFDIQETAGGRLPTVVFCGDYIDRGPQSDRVIEALVWLRGRGDLDVRTLKGNHEALMLRFLDDPASGPTWIRNGGDATLRAYGVEPPEETAEWPELVETRDRFLARMPASHLFLLERLELKLVVNDYVFVHAGVRPGVPIEEQIEEDLLWIRGPFLKAEGPSEKVVVHGHSWIDDQPTVRPDRIGLDTGAYFTGILTAARLDGEAVGIIQAAEERSAR